MSAINELMNGITSMFRLGKGLILPVFFFGIILGGVIFSPKMSIASEVGGHELDQCLSVRNQVSNCHRSKLSDEQILSSFKLSEGVKKKLLEIEKAENSRGRLFKVALINRQGLNLDYLTLLKDKDVNGQDRPLDQLVAEATYDDPQLPGRKVVDYGYFYSQRDRSQALDFTHLGILVRNDSKAQPEEGDWIVYQLLWSCEKNSSEIYRSYIEKFFLDELSAYRSQIMLLDPVVQERMETLLLKKKKEITQKLHGNSKSYNAAANWKVLGEQNSNQWVLEVIAAALKPVGQIQNRQDALSCLIEAQYRPSQVFLSGLFALVTFPGVHKFLPNTACLKNQKYALQFGLGEVVTSLSILEFLKRNQILTDLVLIENPLEHGPGPQFDEREQNLFQ